MRVFILVCIFTFLSFRSLYWNKINVPFLYSVSNILVSGILRCKEEKLFPLTILHTMRVNRSFLHQARPKHLTNWLMSPAQWGRGHSYSLGPTVQHSSCLPDFSLSCNGDIFVANVLSDEREGHVFVSDLVLCFLRSHLNKQLCSPHQQKKWDALY